eukprot:4233508-Pleurochrysis_carterae.AAC.1
MLPSLAESAGAVHHRFRVIQGEWRRAPEVASKVACGPLRRELDRSRRVGMTLARGSETEIEARVRVPSALPGLPPRWR